jgi:hypothetical protein
MVHGLHQPTPAAISGKKLMRFLWLVFLVLATVPLAGCEAISAIYSAYSASLWVGGLLLVLILWLAAMIAIKVRGG